MMRDTYQKDKTISRERVIRDFYLSIKKTINENVNVRVVPLLLLSLFLTVLAFTGTAAQEAVAYDGDRLKVQESYGILPLHPFGNRSQMDGGRIRYFEKGNGHTTYFAKDGVPQSFMQGIKPENRSHSVSPPPVFAASHTSADAGAKLFKNGNIYPSYPGKTLGLRYWHEFGESAGFNLYSGQKLDLSTLRGAAAPENNFIYASEGGSISGRVTDSNVAGIQNVWVYVYDTNGYGISSASTDANGNYTVTGIPTGVYKVQFYGSALGYVNERYNNKPNSENPDPVPVTAPNTTVGIDAVLEPGGSISGRVTDSTNAGIQSVLVYVYDTNGNAISSASTDANGNYTAKGIPTGAHKVRFYGSELGYVNEWYDNKTDFESADTVAVTAPNATIGIDAVLELGGRISGRVTDLSGAGIQNVWVEVTDTNGYQISDASTDANGNYTAIGIPTGVYKVFFDGSYLGYFNEWYNNKKHDFGNPDSVPVTAPNTTTGIDAILELGGSISGRVTDSGGAGIQNVWVYVYTTSIINWVSWVPAKTDANGNYTASGIPAGTYKIQFDGRDLGYINEWFNNKPYFGNADADIVPVTEQNTTTGIDAVLEAGGSISGRITDSTGAGIQNVSVYVHDTNWGGDISSASTDATGNYTAGGIPTGVYKVRFYGSHLGYINERYDNKPDFGNADPVAVTAPNVTSGIDAVLELGGSISGRVTDSTGTGIQNVWVTIYDSNRVSISGTSTDANGNYAAIGLPTGVYKVEFEGSHLGYINELYNNKYGLCNANPVAVTAPNATTGIDVVLEPGGSISGKVTDSTGAGIQNVWVTIYDSNRVWISGTSTDANGNYTAIGLPTGSYKVEFYGNYMMGYINEWYNNKPDFGNADFVAVTAPNATTGIDAVLEVGGSISGMVADSAGRGIQNVWVEIININGDWISWALTDADGNYTATGVPTGAHKVRFYGSELGYINELYDNKPDFGNADTVAVTAPNPTVGINAVLEPGVSGSGSISGRVTDSTGTGIQNVWVKVYDPNWGKWALWGSPDADGNYIANGLSTGQYKVQFVYDGCSGYLSEWYNNKPDSVSADTVAVTAPDTTAGIDAVLSVKTWFEENDPAITCTGDWKTYTCTQCSGGALKYSKQTAARCEFSFNGKGIKWLVAKGPMMGKARVYLDGINKGLVDLYSATTKFKQTLQAIGLTPGNHTIAIEVSGQKNTNATDKIINIDAFEVVP